MNAADLVQQLKFSAHLDAYRLAPENPGDPRIEVSGALNLGDVKLPANIEFVKVDFDSEVSFEGVALGSLVLDECTAPGLRLRSLRATKFVKLAGSSTIQGTLDLSHAKIDGFVDLTKASIGGSCERALDLEHARIDGLLDLSGATLHASREAIYGDNLRVGELRAKSQFGTTGDLRLVDAAVRTELCLDGATLRGSLIADRLHVGSTAIIRHVSCEHLVLVGGQIGSDLEFNCKDVAGLKADGLAVEGVVTIQGGGVLATKCLYVSLRGARCEEVVELKEIHLQYADFEHAHFGALQIEKCSIHRASLLGLRVDRDCLVGDPTSVLGQFDARELEVGRLCRLKGVVHDTLNLSGGRFGSLELKLGHSPSQPPWQLDARRIEVSRTFQWKPNPRALPEWVDLSFSRVGVLDDGNDVTRWPEAPTKEQQELFKKTGIALDGFTYDAIALPSTEERHHTEDRHSAVRKGKGRQPKPAPVELSFYGTPSSFLSGCRYWVERKDQRKNSRRDWLMKQDPVSHRERKPSLWKLNAFCREHSPNPLPRYSPQPIEQLADVFSKMGYANEAAEAEMWGQWLKSTKANRNRRIGETIILKTWAALGFGVRWGRVLALWFVIGAFCSLCFDYNNMRPASASRFKAPEKELTTGSGQVLIVEHPDYTRLSYTLDTLVPFFDLRSEVFWIPVTFRARLAHHIGVVVGWAFGALFLISVSRRIKRW